MGRRQFSIRNSTLPDRNPFTPPQSDRVRPLEVALVVAITVAAIVAVTLYLLALASGVAR